MTDDLRHVRDAGDGLALGLCGGGVACDVLSQGTGRSG